MTLSEPCLSAACSVQARWQVQDPGTCMLGCWAGLYAQCSTSTMAERQPSEPSKLISNSICSCEKRLVTLLLAACLRSFCDVPAGCRQLFLLCCCADCRLVHLPLSLPHLLCQLLFRAPTITCCRILRGRSLQPWLLLLLHLLLPTSQLSLLLLLRQLPNSKTREVHQPQLFGFNRNVEDASSSS